MVLPLLEKLLSVPHGHVQVEQNNMQGIVAILRFPSFPRAWFKPYFAGAKSNAKKTSRSAN
jgi:hypothetical protein